MKRNETDGRTADRATVRAERELALYTLLERLQSERTPTTPSDFARRAGFRATTSLNAYPDVLAAVRQYARESAPDRMRHAPPPLTRGARGRYIRLRSEHAQSLETLARLRDDLAANEAAREALAREQDMLRAQLARTQRCVAAMVAEVANREEHIGREVERTLRALTVNVLAGAAGGVDGVVRDDATPRSESTPSQPPPGLRAGDTPGEHVVPPDLRVVPGGRPNG